MWHAFDQNFKSLQEKIYVPHMESKNVDQDINGGEFFQKDFVSPNKINKLAGIKILGSLSFSQI